MIGFENISVTSPYRIKVVQDVQMEWKPNEHGRLFIRGLVDDQDQVNAVLKASTDDQVQVFDGETKIFSGLIANVQTKHHNGIYSIEIEAISGTSRLDAQKRRRSFQNKNMTYGELVKSVLKAYAGYDVIQLVGENEPIGEPIIQYEETDWEFLKRMASHLQSVVFSDIYETKPRMYIGVPNRNSIQLPDDLPYTASKDLLAYQEARSGAASVHHTDFFTYEVQSGTRYAIGDEVLFRDKPMVISEMKAAMDQGQLIYNYRLSRRDGIRQNQIHNSKLVGISMNGKVLDVKGQQVKLHLEIDQEQSPASAYWFPFAPPTGSAMYSMPQKGTNASLYFPDDAGSKAKVIGCVRTNGEDCSKTGDPNNRYFGTEHGSELEITPTAINVVSGSKEPLMISFDDAAGVILTSHRKLTMNAGEDVSLYTPKRVVFRTPNMILAKKLSKLSGFTVESEYHLLGSQVKLDGADRTSYPKYNDEIETYTPPQEEKSGGWGFWDKVCAAVAVVVVVALVVTATVVTGGVAGAILMGAAFGAVGAVGATLANDLARGEWSSGETYLRSALTGGIVGAVTGGIFGPVGGAASTTLLPATTSQVASGFTAMLASGFASGYTDYTLTELINGRRPTFREAVTVGAQSAMFSGFLVGLRPVKNALQDLFTKGIKPSTTSRQPHVDGPEKGPEWKGKGDKLEISNDLYNRTKEIRDQIKQKANEIRNSEAFKNLSSKQRRILEQKLRRLETGNLAAARVEIPGIKKDHVSHSQINTLDDLFADLDNFTHQSNNRIFETYVEDGFPRYQDTEAKILEDIASQIKDPTIKGEIDLFSHFDVCQSCTNLILEFRRKFPNIKLNIYTNSMR